MLALAKSQPRLIDVRFSLAARTDAPVNVAFLEACNHIHRWRSVWLSLRHWKGQLGDCLSGPAPFLETVYTKGQLWRRDDTLVNLFGGQAPRLRELGLDALAIPWNTPMLSDLTCLKLEFLRSHTPTLAELMAVLQASPSLSTLKLHFMRFQPPALEPAPSIDLHHLQRLTLIEVDAPILGYLLSHIQCPPCQYLEVDCGLSNDDDLAHFEHLHPFIPSVQGEIALNVGERSVEYAHRDDVTLVLEFRRVGSIAAILRHLTCLLPTQLLALTTKLELDTWSSRQVTALLETVAAMEPLHITSLVVQTKNVGLERMLGHLGAPHQGRWLLPALRELDVELEGVTPGLLATTVAARAATAPITKVSGRHGYAEDYDKLERLIGAENVVWGDTTP